MASTRVPFILKRLFGAPSSRNKQSATQKSILFISPTGDFSNGAERCAYQLMKLLAEKGHHVFNAHPARSLQVEGVYRAALNKAGVSPICIPELRWWPDAPGGDINTPPDAPADLRAIDTIHEIIRAHDIDVVVSNTVNTYHGALAAAMENTRHIWLIHEFPEGEFGYYRNKAQFISAYSDAIFCVEGTLQESLESLMPEREIGTFLPYTNPGEMADELANGEKDSVTLNGEVDSAQLAGTSSSKPSTVDERDSRAKSPSNRIICIGLISERKNQLELLYAYALLPEEFKSLELVFVGGNGDDITHRNLCNDFIASNSLTKVSFIGHLEKPWSFVSERDIVVLPSKSETFGCVYVEALMNGVPVIASDNDGFAKVQSLFGAGKLYTRGNPEALAKAIAELLHNFDDEKEKAEAIAPRVRRAFAPEHAYAQLVAEITCDKQPRRKKPCSSAQLNGLICTSS